LWQAGVHEAGTVFVRSGAELPTTAAADFGFLTAAEVSLKPNLESELSRGPKTLLVIACDDDDNDDDDDDQVGIMSISSSNRDDISSG